MAREEQLREIREMLARRNAWRINFIVRNYVGEVTACTGWLLEGLGYSFHRVWSDQHWQYIAVHASQVTSHKL